MRIRPHDNFFKPNLSCETVLNLRKRAIGDKFPISDSVANWLAEHAFGGNVDEK